MDRVKGVSVAGDAQCVTEEAPEVLGQEEERREREKGSEESEEEEEREEEAKRTRPDGGEEKGREEPPRFSRMKTSLKVSMWLRHVARCVYCR